MNLGQRIRAFLGAGVVGWAGLAASGCATGEVVRIPPVHDLPRELDKVSLPPYRIEPPDVLLIEAVKAVPKPPYKVEPLDVLLVHLANPVRDEPLSGLITVEPDGTINLGPAYKGAVQVAGMTIPEVTRVVEAHLKKTLNDPQVTVSLAQSRAGQRVTGPHLVRPDGTVSLGTYGMVRVVGLTLAEARAAIEAQLSHFLLQSEVLV